MVKKAFTDESLATFVDEIRNYADNTINTIMEESSGRIPNNTIVIDGDETVNVDISGITGIEGDGFIRVADVPEGIDPFDYFNFTIDVTVEQEYEQTYTDSVSSSFGEVFGENDEGEPIIVGKPFVSYAPNAEGVILFVFQDNAEVTRNIMEYNFAGVIFPKTGVYLRSLNAYNNEVSSSVVTISQTFVFNDIELTNSTEKIKTEYLPDTVATKTMTDDYFGIKNEEGTQYFNASKTGVLIVDGSKAVSVMSDTIQFNGTSAENANGRITGLATPTADDEATNKAYVDDAIATAIESAFANIVRAEEVSF